jgi:hypothetical protein
MVRSGLGVADGELGYRVGFFFFFSKIGITTGFGNVGDGVSDHRHLVHNDF